MQPMWVGTTLVTSMGIYLGDRVALLQTTSGWVWQDDRDATISEIWPHRSGSRLGQEQGALFTALMQSGMRLRAGRGEFVLGIRN